MAALSKTIRKTVLALGGAALVSLAAPAAATTFTFDEFVTYDQTIWGGPLIAGTPPQLIHDNFHILYPGVFELGIPLSSGGHFMDFTDQSTLLTYLPQSQAPAALNANVTDPDSTSSGIFGGQIAALKLDIDFSDAGLLAHPSGAAFGDLVFTGLTGDLTGVDGLTIRQVSSAANIQLGGGAEAYSFVDFSSLLTGINAAFDGGFVSDFAQDHLELPAIATPAPEPSTWLLLLVSMAGFGFDSLRRRSTARRSPTSRVTPDAYQ
jgi:hypothetical protein